MILAGQRYQKKEGGWLEIREYWAEAEIDVISDCGTQMTVTAEQLIAGLIVDKNLPPSQRRKPELEIYSGAQKLKGRHDRTGRRYGKYTVLGKAANWTAKKRFWLLQCQCGKQKINIDFSLRKVARKNKCLCKN